MAERTPAGIVDLVQSHADDTTALRDRWENDWSLYRLDDFKGDMDEDVDGYRVYTSNEPATFADKIKSWIVSSELLIRILQEGQPREAREANGAKERFLYGILAAADERLRRMILPTLRETLGFHATLRGWVAGRAVLQRTDRGTRVDIMPFDPLHTYWAEGPDGLAWICHKIRRSRGQIQAMYGVDVEALGDNEGVGIEVYDFYDTVHNTVVTADHELKPSTEHGSPRTPGFVIPVGSAPPIQPLASGTMDETIANYGESVFKNNRNLFGKHNLMMSIMLHLTAMARKPTIIYHSADGEKATEGELWEEASEIGVARDEQIEVMRLLETSRDTGAFLGLLSAEKQRGSLPNSAYGELPFQLSGYAINRLGQDIGTVLMPPMNAVMAGLTEICRLIVDQYVQGGYDPITLSGRDQNRQYFSQQITHETLQEAGDFEIELKPELPQDEITKFAMAQMAREGPEPLFDDRTIRDRILDVPDTDEIHDKILEQRAGRVLPEAQLWELMQGAARMGRMDLAQMYFGRITMMYAQMMGVQTGPVPEDGGGQNGSNGRQGVNPQAAPAAQLGQQPQLGAATQGPQSPPGTPRPGGAQSPGQQLSRLGLFGPRG